MQRSRHSGHVWRGPSCVEHVGLVWASWPASKLQLCHAAGVLLCSAGGLAAQHLGHLSQLQSMCCNAVHSSGPGLCNPPSVAHPVGTVCFVQPNSRKTNPLQTCRTSVTEHWGAIA
jgi:hypothetical protein